jgi:hypothetical protein
LAQIDQPSAKRGKSYGPSRATKILCRICGEPTRYNGLPGTVLDGRVHCGRDACREASQALKNAAIGARAVETYASGERRRATGAWSKVARISREEQMLAPWFEAHGWKQQFGFVPGISDIHLPRYFILDFAQPDRRLYVEIDGTVHRMRRERDVRKDAIMQERGWRGLRLPASLVATNIDEAIHLIEDRFAI